MIIYDANDPTSYGWIPPLDRNRELESCSDCGAHGHQVVLTAWKEGLMLWYAARCGACGFESQKAPSAAIAVELWNV